MKKKSSCKNKLIWTYNPNKGIYWSGNRGWNVTTLFEEARNLPVQTMPVSAIDTSRKMWSIATHTDIVRHVIATRNANLDYPIILSEDGEIMDGWHRITKAITENIPTIKFVRFKENPAPDQYKEEED